jgi:hypothetical protein
MRLSLCIGQGVCSTLSQISWYRDRPRQPHTAVRPPSTASVAP